MALVCVTLAVFAIDSVGARPVAVPTASSCRATQVHYERTARLPGGTVWVEARSSSGTFGASLLYYRQGLLADERANQVDALVAYAGTPLPIRWSTPPSRRFAVVARRLDGSAAVRQSISSRGRTTTFTTSLRLPSEGCWTLSLGRDGGSLAHLRLVALDRPPEPVCDATPLHYEPNQSVGNSQPWLSATPVRAQLRAIGSVTTTQNEGSVPPRAAIYTGGKQPNGAATKILWVPGKPSNVDRTLTIIGHRLDAPGSFKQVEDRATGGTAPLSGPVFPSIPNVPTAGCWVFTLQSGKLGAIAVFAAVQP
jgi:hypothetical protein